MRLSLALLVLLGCSSDSDPFAGGVDADTNGGDDSDDTTDDSGDDPPGIDAATGPAPIDAGAAICAPAPARVVVLGDSITDCTVIGGENGADCVSKLFYDAVKARHAAATYENYAVGGSVLDNLKTQLAGVPVKPGHVLLMVYIGGNDLSPYIFVSDSQAQAAYEQVKGRLDAAWANVFAVVNDTSKFPDGATVVINNQYNPFDDCTAPPYNLSQVKSGLLHDYNARVAEIAAAQAPRALVVDQYTPFLGHGHHFMVSSCPFYMSGLEGYMKDLIHPNAAGNRELATHLGAALDHLYGGCD